MRSGYFITLEGVDGVGKTSLMKLLADQLVFDSFPEPLLTKEPGEMNPITGVPHDSLGPEIRKILFHSVTTKNMAPGVADCLLLADHIQHIERVIKPALAAKRIVISDRYTDSEFAYASAREITGIKSLLAVYAEFFGPVPDTTVLILGDPEVCLVRARSRMGEQHQSGKAWDSVDKQRVIQDWYVTNLGKEPRTVIVSSEGLTVQEVFDSIYPVIRTRINNQQSVMGSKQEIVMQETREVAPVI